MVVFHRGFGLFREAKMGEDYAMYMKDHAMATVGVHGLGLLVGTGSECLQQKTHKKPHESV